jgi:acetate---CoA ligase (ADP-forming)
VPEGIPHRPDPAPLLEPRSVAVVGATDRLGSYGDTVLRNLERAGYAGPVWGVHPTRSRVHGRDCVPSPADLPEPVDAVVFAIPAAKVPASLAEAAERGCRGAIVLAAGFGEAPDGAQLERELTDVAARAGVPLCGPNGNGVISVAARAPLWGDSVPELRPGPVAMITQSGNLAVNAIGSRRGIDFHTLVSAGNQTVLDAADWLAAVAAREGVRSVALFLEEDGDGSRLAESLALCAEHGVGVAVLKVGESRAGAEAAAAHTGAVAGDQRAFRALVEEAGAIWVRDPHELLEVARVLAEPRARPNRRGGLADGGGSRRRGGAGAAYPRRSDGAEARRSASTGRHPWEPPRLHLPDLGGERAARLHRRGGRRGPGYRAAAHALRPPRRHAAGARGAVACGP